LDLLFKGSRVLTASGVEGLSRFCLRFYVLSTWLRTYTIKGRDNETIPYHASIGKLDQSEEAWYWEDIGYKHVYCRQDELEFAPCLFKYTENCLLVGTAEIIYEWVKITTPRPWAGAPLS